MMNEVEDTEKKCLSIQSTQTVISKDDKAQVVG